MSKSGPTRRRRRFLSVFGLAPFFGYVAFFLLVPAAVVMVDAFRANNGSLSLSTLSAVLSSQQPWLHSYGVSLELSAISAVLAGMIGLVAAVALVNSRSAAVGKLVTSACGVLANTGGVPLAFAFIATIGNAGIVTHVLAERGAKSLRSRLVPLLF